MAISSWRCSNISQGALRWPFSHRILFWSLDASALLDARRSSRDSCSSVPLPSQCRAAISTGSVPHDISRTDQFRSYGTMPFFSSEHLPRPIQRQYWGRAEAVTAPGGSGRFLEFSCTFRDGTPQYIHRQTATNPTPSLRSVAGVGECCCSAVR